MGLNEDLVNSLIEVDLTDPRHTYVSDARRRILGALELGATLVVGSADLQQRVTQLEKRNHNLGQANAALEKANEKLGELLKANGINTHKR